MATEENATAVEPVPVSPLRDGIPSASVTRKFRVTDAELIEVALVMAFRELAKSLEAESKASAKTARAKSGFGGMMDAAEATAIFKVAQHIWKTAQAIEARRAAPVPVAVHESAVGETDAPATPELRGDLTTTQGDA